MIKTKLTLSMDESKIKELKKKAIDMGITLSELLLIGGVILTYDQIVEYYNKEHGKIN